MLLLLDAQAGATFAYAGSGGLAFGGAGLKARTRAASASGGLALSGAANHARTRSSAASGGFQTGGLGGHSRVRATPVSGGQVLGGSAPSLLQRLFGWVASGGVAIAGVAQAYFAAGSTYSAGSCSSRSKVGVKVGL